jgi:hypothetical protein
MANDLQDTHRLALRRFGEIWDAVQDEREQCMADRRFAVIAGAQWEGALGDQFKSRPKFEVNKIQLSVLRVLNEYLNNRITVDFVSKAGAPGADQLADLCDGLYRADQLDSGSDEAQDNAFIEAVFGGFGAWRLRADYEDPEDEDNEYQRICFEPIYDADSCVFFDPAAMRQDKRDAKYAFVLTPLTRESYKEQYNDEPNEWAKPQPGYPFEWASAKHVYVAEYYEIAERKVQVETWLDLKGNTEKYETVALTDDPGLRERLEATGSRREKVRKVARAKVRKLILSGGGVLEDCGHIAGRYIPIVPVYGKRWVIDGIERCAGHVRLAKDAQRLKNMQLSKLGELSALSSVEKPILTPAQIDGHQEMWSRDNIENYPYLLVNPIVDANGNEVSSGPLGYTKSPNIPPAMAALLQMTEMDMKEVLGNQEAGEQIQPNLSGKAIELIQNRLDMQSYIYMANMAKAVKRSGEIWLSIAKEVMLDDERRVKLLDPNGKASYETLRQPVVDEESGQQRLANDLSDASFDIAVDVGPSSNSRRAATVRTLTSMIAIVPDPETQQVLSSLALMNMDGEGIGDARDYFRARMVNMGVVKPTKEEAAQLAKQKANQPPDAQQEYLRAAAEQAVAAAMKARADTELALAKAQQAKAQTAETLAGIDLDEQRHVVEVAERLAAATQPPGGAQ